MADKPSDKRSPTIDLSITGRRCRVHRNNDHAARSLEEGTNLIELCRDTKYSNNWNSGDNDEPSNSALRSSSLLVERNDARTLLDEISLQRICDQRRDMNIDAAGINNSSEYASRPFEEEGNEEDVAARNFERFGALAEYAACFLKDTPDDKSKVANEEKKACRKSSRWGSAASANLTQTKSNAQAEEKPFELSEDQLKGIPPDIPLPKTMRHNTIIEHTTSRIASNNQLEVFLKVKQADNADFSFLNPSDDLHQYYLYLKRKHEKSKHDTSKNSERSDSDDDDDNDASDNPLSGLLGDYASSSDESNGPTQNGNTTGRNSESESGVNTSSGGDNPPMEANHEAKDTTDPNKSEEQDRKRKADRMERLRLWKESRLKQNDTE